MAEATGMQVRAGEPPCLPMDPAAVKDSRSPVDHQNHGNLPKKYYSQGDEYVTLAEVGKISDLAS